MRVLLVLLFFLMRVPYSRAFVINRGSCTSHKFVSSYFSLEHKAYLRTGGILADAEFSSFCALLLVLRKFYQTNI